MSAPVYYVRRSPSGKTYSVVQRTTGQTLRYGIRDKAEAERDADRHNHPTVVGETPDQRTAIETAVTYCTTELRLAHVRAIGLVEWADAYIVRCAPLDQVIRVEWQGSHRGWEATQELSLTEYGTMSATPATCNYCMAETTVGQLTLGVCPTCHAEGIES